MKSRLCFLNFSLLFSLEFSVLVLVVSLGIIRRIKPIDHSVPRVNQFLCLYLYSVCGKVFRNSLDHFAEFGVLQMLNLNWQNFKQVQSVFYHCITGIISFRILADPLGNELAARHMQKLSLCLQISKILCQNLLIL